MLGITHEVYAIISNGVIKELVAEDYMTATTIATSKYGSDAFATDVTHHPVKAGDEYVDGEFRRTNEDGTVSIIYYVPTPLQEIATLKDKNRTLEDELTEAQLALVEQYEANLALQEELTNTQLALCELYEKMA